MMIMSALSTPIAGEIEIFKRDYAGTYRNEAVQIIELAFAKGAHVVIQNHKAAITARIAELQSEFAALFKTQKESDVDKCRSLRSQINALNRVLEEE